MARIYVTDTGGLDFTVGVDHLSAAGHEVTVLELTDSADVVEQAADADALLVSFLPIDTTVIAALPNLRAIATTTVGLDQIDLAAARDAGIDVRPLPNLASEEVATHALAGILALLRELGAGQQATAGWDFRAIPAPPRISELTLALYGMGRIAQALVERARPLFGRIVGFDPHLPAEQWPAGVDRVDDPAALFAVADVLSLHTPATPETRHAVDARTIELLPPGAIVVNVARGEVVDHVALLAAVDSGRLRGAFLDVLDPEPPSPDDPILHHPRVIVTPHAAFYSTTTARSYVLAAAQNAADALGVAAAR
ncbi:MAG TPA: NAD(P)-dependent oxidoreductase [Nocardioides sp.]|nr:NAD(P)-dependent oxidoreductase [Nocardioides sp.]